MTRQGDRWGIQARFAAGSADVADGQRAAARADALAAVDAYFEALDDPTDVEAWASTLNYPHVRVADGTVEQWETAEDYIDGLQGGRLRTWAGTRLDWAEPGALSATANHAASPTRTRRRRRAGARSYGCVSMLKTRGAEET